MSTEIPLPAVQQPRRARELGIRVGLLPAGAVNAITDVPGVLVGHRTIDNGAHLRTGVTAIVPTRLAEADQPLPAAVFAGNGYGKLVGSTQVDELGVLESPVVLTATLSVFRAADAVVTYLMALHPDRQSFNPVVGETNDGYLSDIRSRPVTEQHVLDAIRDASAGLPPEGCVGAGTGTVALGYKSGIGTSSRVVDVGGAAVTVGALVQANFPGRLQVLGTSMPAEWLLGPAVGGTSTTEGSCMIVVATDAVLDARQLRRLARRAVFAMANVGAAYTHGSGDYAIAFATGAQASHRLPDDALDPVFAATMDAVTESLLNSLFMATSVAGKDGRVALAVPHDEVIRRLAASLPAAG